MKVCTLMSGSSGNAIYIETAKSRVLIDAGQTGKCVAQALEQACGISPKTLDSILVTHAHRDHTQGVGILSRRFGLPVYATEGTWYEMDSLIGPVRPEHKRVIGQDKWEIGDLAIQIFPTSHDALESVGYVIEHESKRLGIATDSGVFTTRMNKELQDLDCLILESNHDTGMLKNGPYPWPLKKRIASIHGHLSNESAGDALARVIGGRTKNVILAHLSEENNRPKLALETVKEILRNRRICLDQVNITVASRYIPGAVLEI